MERFSERNRQFWSVFHPNEGNWLLVEEPRVPLVIHGNAVFSILLNQAKSLIPVWITKSPADVEMVQSYVPNARGTALLQIPLWQRIWLGCLAVYHYMRILLTRSILSFSYDGVKYGDIVYDTYLAQHQAATIRRMDRSLVWLLYGCMLRHASIATLLRSGPYEGVLVSHQVGLRSGVMLRAALRYGYKGYLRCGHGTLREMRAVDEVYDYPFKPSPQIIDRLVEYFGDDLDRLFEEELTRQVGGGTSRDNEFAFSPKNTYFRERASFQKAFHLDPTKKNAFIMLHAMNDHPHSHFRSMLFRDYFDWFYHTLRFAWDRPEVNWIFKQHPSIRFYPVKDVSFEALFRGAPPHIAYISEKNQIDTRSLSACADWVITCAGSAGFELPAMAGIPSVVAADNAYAGLGFANEPATRAAYFEALSNLASIGPLPPEKQHRARATYLYNYGFARIPVTACPFLSFSESKDPAQEHWYWDRVQSLYSEKGKGIVEEMRAYIADIGRPEFRQLSRLPFPFETA